MKDSKHLQSSIILLSVVIFAGVLFSSPAAVSTVGGQPLSWNTSNHPSQDGRAGTSTIRASPITESCTIFTAAIGDRVFFGNNEDYFLDGTYLWLVPSQEITTPEGTSEIFGAAFFGFDSNDNSVDGYPQGGINIHGLCVDGNGLPTVPMNPHPERDYYYGYLLSTVLWECRTVEEVITWFQTHYLGDSWSCQLPFADATGDAVVVSVGTDGEFAFTRIGTSNYLVSTNFNLANYANGHYPCWRYETATYMLDDITQEEDLTMEACRDVLEAVHVEGFSATKYSNVFNLVTRTIYLWEPERRGFDEMVMLNLYEELAQVVPGAPGVTTRPELYYILVKTIRITDLFDSSTTPPAPEIEAIVLVLGVAFVCVPVVVTSIALIRKRKSG
ncbi:MAG: hypothetical protein ACFFCO_02730 [Promethearchaeota archaeon]